MNEMHEEYEEAERRKRFQEDFAAAEEAWQQVNFGAKTATVMARVVAEAGTGTKYEVVAVRYGLAGQDEALVSVLSPRRCGSYIMPRTEINPGYVHEKLCPDLRNGGDIAALTKAVNAAIVALA